MKSFEGDTGPYLQYAHVRLASIARKNPHLLPLPAPSQIDIATLVQSNHAREIVFLLGSYPDVVKTAMRTHEPSGMTLPASVSVPSMKSRSPSLTTRLPYRQSYAPSLRFGSIIGIAVRRVSNYLDDCRQAPHRL